jgi:hypothetical protein
MELTQGDINRIADAIQGCACITLTVKQMSYNHKDELMSITLYPLLWLQCTSYALADFKERYGGSFQEVRQRGYRETRYQWRWNISMIKEILPKVVDKLQGDKRLKAEIILEAIQCTHGKGKKQDTKKLIELLNQIRKLQKQRKRERVMFGDEFKWGD